MAAEHEADRRALDLWDPPEGAGRPLACLATTFTFDPAFFETDCLGRFLGMDTHASESDSTAYLIEREEKLADARVCALVDRRHARDKVSYRWDVLPVLIPGALMHAKLSLLAWAGHVRVIIGSGNLTERGYRENLEVFGTLEVNAEAGGERPQIVSCLDFLDELIGHAVGSDSAAGPKKRARDSMRLVRQHIRRWPSDELKEAPEPVFGGPGRLVLKQLAGLWKGSPPREAWVLSPFFDPPPGEGAAVEALAGILARRGHRRVYLSVPYEEMEGHSTRRPRYRVRVPEGLVRAAERVSEVRIDGVCPEQDDGHRVLHAKMLALDSDRSLLMSIGSSNFTARGLGVRGRRANVEANLAYRSRHGSKQARELFEIWPDLESPLVDPRQPDVLWDAQPEQEGEETNVSVLPAAFQDAIYSPSPEPRLRLLLGARLPSSWTIRSVETVLASDRQQGPGSWEFPWVENQPPFVLEVAWDEGKQASWPVNVDEPGALPPPEGLRELTLAELILTLESARPLHEAVLALLRRRERINAGTDAIPPELDPHRRVDTSTFLLRRTRRVARALDRLRERLERPILTCEGLEWRLSGPVSPKALAERFVVESSPAEAQFFLAELALCLSRVRADKASAGGLKKAIVRERLRQEIERLQEGCRSVGATGREGKKRDELRRYVSAAFREARG